VSKLAIILLLDRVRQNLVGFGDLYEVAFGSCLGDVFSFIGMVCDTSLFVGPFDLREGGVRGYTESMEGVPDLELLPI
jgi:hypothetical protein